MDSGIIKRPINYIYLDLKKNKFCKYFEYIAKDIIFLLNFSFCQLIIKFMTYRSGKCLIFGRIRTELHHMSRTFYFNSYKN